MSPSIFKTKNNFITDSQIQKNKENKKIILKYLKFIKKNFDYVGENFTYEARSMYYKNKKTTKRIYGIATKKDLKELKEEGIETEMIPWIKNTTN